ncbi:MAG: glycosyltransferase family protein [Thermodesulfobacteriota bacterium]
MTFSRPVRICLVDGPFGPHLGRHGHEVLELRPSPGIHDIAALLDERGFAPDLLLHTEQLGRRVVLRGVQNLPCRTALWSVDSHLNAHWQAHYGRLFDAVFTTQRHLAGLFSDSGSPAAIWLPWFGYRRPFRPFADRGIEVGFVGRLGPQRPVRGHFADFLRSGFGARIASDLPTQDMFEMYADTRLAPNEALFGEINFRLFETLSAGCLGLTPAVEDLDGLFETGREVETYDSGWDLREKLRFYQARPDKAEVLARAGHAAIAARHLAGHRAESFLAAMREAPGRVRDAGRARLSFHLALLGLMEAGLFPDMAHEVETFLSRRADDPRAVAGLVRLFRLRGENNRLVELCKVVAARQQAGGEIGRDPFLMVTAGLAALAAGAVSLAGILVRGLRADGHAPGFAGRGGEPSRDICLLCAARLREAGRVVRRGFVFDADRHVPQTAVEALILAHSLCPHDLTVIRALDAALAPYRGVEQVRLGLLSILSLHNPKDWRLALRLAQVNARMFRLDPAGEELALARDLARKAGEEKRFAAMGQGLGFGPHDCGIGGSEV